MGNLNAPAGTVSAARTLACEMESFERDSQAGGVCAPDTAEKIRKQMEQPRIFTISSVEKHRPRDILHRQKQLRAPLKASAGIIAFFAMKRQNAELRSFASGQLQ